MYNMNRVGENVASIEEYDVANINVTTYTVSGLSLVGTMHYSFNSDGKQFRKKYVAADGSEQKYIFEYRDEQNVAVQLPTGVVSHAKSDHLGRKVFDELQLGKGLMNRKFTYHKGEITDAHLDNDKSVSDPQTTLVKQIEFADGRTIEYEYDNEERITKVTDSVDGKYEYTYDELGQLLTETVNEVEVNKMTYDGYGNILTKNGISYGYDTTWKDKLISYNGQTIIYDANGNPTNYLGTSATWEKGRQLKTFGNNSYKYNNDGIRIKKQTANEIHEYILDGTNIVKEIVTDIYNCPKYVNEYLYDLDGTVCGLKHDGVAYYFYKNLQGDVIAITDDTGATVAKYTYDAWGKCTIVSDTSGINIANVNPFRYRSYYYDTETELYYLQSRYYDPEVGRFINADDTGTLSISSSIQGHNLFTYCENNPINNKDASGNIIWNTIFKLFMGVIFGLCVQLLSDFLLYILRCWRKGKSNVSFSPHPQDYISSALTWALTFANPFSCFTKKGKMVGKILRQLTNFIPLVSKYIGRKWENIDKFDFFTDLIAVLVGIFIDVLIDKRTANKINDLRKEIKKGKNVKGLKSQILTIKINKKILGEKISITVNFSPTITQLIFKVIFGL